VAGVESLTIGKLADAAGVHVETVRYYERRGLIDQPAQPATGYRRYTADDLWRLRFIARGKELGFTLAEIAEVMGAAGAAGAGGSAERVLAATRAKIAEVEARQRRLYRTRCQLEQLARLCESGDAGCVALQVAPT
jgi:MerR family mercuric resistance operon transcriptional regulator